MAKGKLGHTVESECNEFQTHVAQTNIKARSNSTRPYPCDIEQPRHERLLGLCRIFPDMIMAAGIGDAVGSWSEPWKQVEDYRSKRELNKHMHAGCEKRKWKMKIFIRKHPLVILVDCFSE